MAYTTTVKTRRDGTIELQDGTTPAAVSLTVEYEGDGNLTFSNSVADRVPVFDRGVIRGLRKGNDAILSGSFGINARAFTADQAGNVIDFISKTNAYSANISSGGAAYAFYTVDVTLFVEGKAHGDENAGGTPINNKVILTNCLCTYDFSEGDLNTFTINFECYGTITRAEDL